MPELQLHCRNGRLGRGFCHQQVARFLVIGVEGIWVGIVIGDYVALGIDAEEIVVGRIVGPKHLRLGCPCAIAA